VPRRVGLLALLLLLCPTGAHAHDYWLAPRDFNPNNHDRTTWPRFTPSRSTIADPVIVERAFEREGHVLLGLERNWVDITLSDDRFAFYLEHEGLTEMQALREQQGPRAEENERYTRSIKSLIRVGDRSRRRLHRKVLGHRMEIVLLDDPFRTRVGGQLRAKVLYGGKHLRGVTLSALHSREGGVVTMRADTDARGVASFVIDQPGMWLLRLVYMQHCEPHRGEEGCESADWRSYWASYSFAMSDL
jgi:uncharacterized GH25 family protein